MPTDTFFNLPDEKRARFVDAALDEFAGAPFDQASITAIVKRLGIAKGSVYQYFADKYDLFSWLLAEAGRRKAERFAGAEPPPGDWFHQLVASYRAGLRAWADDPRWSRVGLRLFEPSTEPRLVALRRETEARIHAWIVAELRSGQERGEIRADVDAETCAWLVQGVLQDGLLRAFLARLGTDLEGLTALAPSRSEPRLDHALGAAEEAVALLRSALSPPGSRGPVGPTDASRASRRR